MKRSAIGETGNIGNWMRYSVLVMLLCSIVVPALHFEPWKKVEAFYMKTIGDRLKDPPKQ